MYTSNSDALEKHQSEIVMSFLDLLIVFIEKERNNETLNYAEFFLSIAEYQV